MLKTAFDSEWRTDLRKETEGPRGTGNEEGIYRKLKGLVMLKVDSSQQGSSHSTARPVPVLRFSRLFGAVTEMSSPEPGTPWETGAHVPTSQVRSLRITGVGAA